MAKERLQTLKNKFSSLSNNPLMDIDGNLSTLQSKLSSETSSYNSYVSQNSSLSSQLSQAQNDLANKQSTLSSTQYSLSNIQYTLTRCLVPGSGCNVVYYKELPSREELWDKYYTAVPKRQRQYVSQSKIVKRA
ncbi:MULTISPECIES: hypothetical protein [unclassified Candidatus Tisiphia]|uniref:hypothetical protein n=1 Tax=unclassified Candidatus Tisiphia TaxID=2996318 RepID=UPI00312C71DD